MAIQVRRGYLKDFDPSKMLPGEWAVSIDPSTENQIVWMCFAPGVCKRIGTYEDFQNMIDEINGEIISEYQDAFNVILNEVKVLAKEVSTNADEVAVMHTEIKNDLYPNIEQYLVDAEMYATNSANSAEESKIYAEEAKQYRDEAETIAGFDANDIYSEIKINKQTLGYCKKNLLKNNLTDTTSNGISCVVNEDKSITLNGTNDGTEISTFNLDANIKACAGEYVFSIGEEAGDISKFVVTIGYHYSETELPILGAVQGNKIFFTLENDGFISVARISISRNATVENVTLYPMVHSTKIKDTTYEPYVEDVYTRLHSTEQRLTNAEQGIEEAKNIGLVNLCNGTKDFSGSDWVNVAGYLTDETYKGFRVWKKTNAWGGACQTINAVAGENYVFSCWAKVATSASGVTATAQFFTRNNDQTNGNNSTQDGKWQPVSSEWQRIIVPFTVVTTGTMQPRIENSKANSGGLYVCGIKLEKGTVATDWFCSVNDLDNVGTTIWQNASVLASFAATTITVDTGFAPRRYEILYYDSTDSSVLHSSGRLPIGTKCAIDGVGLNSSGEIVSFTRYIEVTKNNIVIGEGKIFHPTNKATAQSNYWAIPYKVIFYP